LGELRDQIVQEILSVDSEDQIQGIEALSSLRGAEENNSSEYEILIPDEPGHHGSRLFTGKNASK
jgi:hypothetical protein